MALTAPATPIADIHGQLSKTDKIVFRVRDGIMQSYAVKNPYHGKPTEAQTRQRNKFAQITAQLKTIYDDPEQLELWQQRFKKYIDSRTFKKQFRQYLAEQKAPAHTPSVVIPKALRTPKPPTTLYGFIFASLADNA